MNLKVKRQAKSNLIVSEKWINKVYEKVILIVQREIKWIDGRFKVSKTKDYLKIKKTKNQHFLIFIWIN